MSTNSFEAGEHEDATEASQISTFGCNNNNNNSTFILKERGFTKSYVAKYRLFTPHQ